MNAVKYKGLSDSYKVVEVQAGKTIRESFPDVDFEKVLIVVNARKEEPDYVLKEGDGILIRELPGAISATTLLVGAIVVGIIGGAAVGYEMYQQKAALERYQSELDKMKNQTNSDSVVNLPFLKGASNSLATGKSQPYLLGRSMFTPYLLTKKWYELNGVNGENQFVTSVFECGFGKQVIESINADEICLKELDTSAEPQNGSGELMDTLLTKEGTYEIRQDGSLFRDLTMCNARIASESPCAAVPYTSDIEDPSQETSDLIYALDKRAKDVTLAITFSNGLYKTDTESGNHRSTTAGIEAAYSLDSGATWTAFPFKKMSRVVVTDKVFTEQVTAWCGSPYESVAKKSPATYFKSEYAHYSGLGYVIDDVKRKGGSKIVGSRSVKTAEGYIKHEFVYNYKYKLTFKKYVQHYEYPVTDVYSFTANTTNELRYEATKEFSYEDIQALEENGAPNIYIRVRNNSTKDSYTQNSCSILYYQSHCYNPDLSDEDDGLVDDAILNEKARLNSVMLAVRIKANDANSSKLGKVNVVSNSVARVVEDDAWTETKALTSNPAALLLEVLTSGTHALSRFSDDEIDLDSFIDLYDFCEENNFQYNAVQTQKASKQDLLSSICNVCRANIYWNLEGKLAAAFDGPRGTSVAVLDSNSVIEVSSKKDFKRRVDAIRITYTEADTWEQKSELVLRNGISELGADSVVQELNVTGIQYLDHIYKYARYYLACQAIRLKTVTVKVGAEGVCFTPWTRITLQDDSLGEDAQNYIITSIRSDGLEWTLECVDYDENIYREGEIRDYSIEGRSYGVIAEELPDQYVRKGDLDETLGNIISGQDVVGNPDAPVISVCSAKESNISLTAVRGGIGLRNEVSSVEWQLFKWNSSTEESDETLWEWQDLNRTAELATEYTFNRNTDGWPEASDLNSNDSIWYFRCRVTNAYNNTSDWSSKIACGTSNYGTWQLETPELSAKVTDRTITIKMAVPARADGKATYGNIKYRVQVKRPDIDSQYYKPADTLDPYALETNYKQGSGYVLSDGTYVQTMPLIGQESDALINTLYMFSVSAQNEAGVSGAGEISATALCTSIRDIVKANETAKEAYITGLSALSANLGVISQGSLTGSGNNYWELSSFRDDNGNYHHEGAFRVGGENEYLRVIPIDENGDDITGNVPDSASIASYRIEFKVGNFEVSTEASNFNGELIVQETPDSLDRVRVSYNGVYFEHRYTANDSWQIMALQNVNGVQTEQVWSGKNLVISNQNIDQRRLEKTDLGIPYLSNNGKVYHFDTDENDQDGNNDLTIADGEIQRTLVSTEDTSAHLNCTPAILATSPYSNIGRSLYGQMSVSRDLGNLDTFTTDFWFQFLADEGQTLFSAGNATDEVSLRRTAGECYIFGWEGGDNERGGKNSSPVPMFEEMRGTAPYYLIERNVCQMFENGMLLKESGVCRLVSEYKKDFVTGGKYYKAVMNSDGKTVYIQQAVTRANYADYADAGLYERTCNLNTPAGSRQFISHSGTSQSERLDLEETGIDFTDNTWLHVAVVQEASKIYIYLADVKGNSYNAEFARYGKGSRAAFFELNAEKKSVIIDELYFDTEIAETFRDFCAHTASRIPWGSLENTEDFLMLLAKDTEKIVTNLGEGSVLAGQLGNNGTLKKLIVDLIHPVGSVFSSAGPENPAALFEGTQWQELGQSGAYSDTIYLWKRTV